MCDMVEKLARHRKVTDEVLEGERSKCDMEWGRGYIPGIRVAHTVYIASLALKKAKNIVGVGGTVVDCEDGEISAVVREGGENEYAEHLLEQELMG